MPNWCLNELDVNGNEEDVAAFISGVQSNSILETYAPLPDGVEATATSQSDWWGCKWKDQFTVPDWEIPQDSVTLTFETPWGPPMEGLRKISARWPQLSLYLQYREEGMCFCGVAGWRAGEEIFSHETEIPEFEYPDEDDYLDITGKLDTEAYEKASDAASTKEYKFYDKQADILQAAMKIDLSPEEIISLNHKISNSNE